MLRKLLILLIKYIPIIQMVGMLFNNIIYYFNINNTITYTLDFIIGNSIITTILLYICSYIFKFCKWHRIIITANLINIFIAQIDIIFYIPISDLVLLITYYIISVIAIIVATYNHLKQNKSETYFKRN